MIISCFSGHWMTAVRCQPKEDFVSLSDLEFHPAEWKIQLETAMDEDINRLATN